MFAGDPWDGRGLEWSTSAPPPEYNFAIIPHTEARDAFYDGKRKGGYYQERARYEAIAVPKNSMTGLAIGLSVTAAAFGLVEAGLGVAAVPSMAMPADDHPLLVSVPLVEPVITRRIAEPLGER